MRFKLRLASIIALLVPTVGCLLHSSPLPMRLDDETQRGVNDAWQNALTPVDRLDRDLLLDVMLNYAMYWHGVDRVRATAEKDLISGRVIMEVSFDRSQPPESDTFSITVVDASDRILRVERFSRFDIDARRANMESGILISIGDPENLTEEERAAMQEEEDRHIQRQRQIIAATQPAGWSDDSSED